MLLRAYAEEFGPDDDVTLILKPSPTLGYTAEQMVAAMEEHLQRWLGRGLDSAPNIIVQDTLLPDDLMLGLYRAADAFVSPTRGARCGQAVREAMAAGLPVVATGWGGAAEHVSPETGATRWVMRSRNFPRRRAANPRSIGHTGGRNRTSPTCGARYAAFTPTAPPDRRLC